jgi:hypothetical protein
MAWYDKTYVASIGSTCRPSATRPTLRWAVRTSAFVGALHGQQADRGIVTCAITQASASDDHLSRGLHRSSVVAAFAGLRRTACAPEAGTRTEGYEVGLRVSAEFAVHTA